MRRPHLALAPAAVQVTSAAQGSGVHPLTGREYALPMSAAGAAWLDRDEREQEEATDLSPRLIEVQRGSIVADIGAGSGYYSTRLARRVGPGGRVYANDIQPARGARIQLMFFHRIVTTDGRFGSFARHIIRGLRGRLGPRMSS